MFTKLNWRGIGWKNRYGRVVRWPWQSLALLAITPILFALLLGLTLNRSLRFARMFRDSPGEAAALYAEVGRTSVENLMAVEPAPYESPLPTLRLYVPKNTLQLMHVASVSGDPELGHEVGGDRPYFRAYYGDESGQLQKSKICYRGLMHYHHWPEKPSLRVKIKKGQIERGQRYVELSRPKDALAMRNQLPEMLARDLEIMTTLNEQVRLFVNNKFFGVYLRSYRPGEALALKSGRMPGTFFKGDLVGQHDLYEHLDLWETSAHWKLFGEAVPEDVALFDELLEALRQPPTTESLTRLAELLDTECLARWSAIMIVTGSVHTDDRHNQTYFYCANQGKFEIMPWDPTLYEVADRPFTPVNTFNHPVLERMSRNPRWVHRRNQLIHELVNGPGSAEAVSQHVDETLVRTLGDLKADVHLSKKETVGRGRVPVSIWDIDDEVTVIKNWATAKESFLREYLNDACVSVEPHPDLPGESLVHVFGNVGVRATGADGSVIQARDLSGGSVELLHPGLSEELHTAIFKPHDVEKELLYATAVTLTYTVSERPENLVFHNAITGQRVQPRQTDIPTASARTLAPATFPKEPVGDVVLGPGEVLLSNDLFIGHRQKLVIRPGTTIRLQEGVGIYSRGKVIAKGTPSAGIRIEPAGDTPWAAFGVSGVDSAGSQFEYVSVSGGSVGADLGLRYKGMFNVYNCPDVVVRHCRFGVNHVGDDAVNLAESNIRVEHCQFQDARSDALDIDMCTGTVRQCHWLDSGNDGLDMMSCRLCVSDCTFIGSGDKGISVGEGSKALIHDCRIERCSIGMEVKDASRVVVRDTTFDANETAYHSYRKKWLYPAGGSGLLIDCQLRDSRLWVLGIEAKSNLSLLRTPAEGDSLGQLRVRTVTTIEPPWQELIQELGAL